MDIMLIGEYAHTIDAKKRLAIPAKFRKELGNTLIVTRGLDSCLFVYPEREWKTLADKLGKLPIAKRDARSFLRLMLAGAMEVHLDRLGRILIPDYLKAYAHIEKQVVVTGLYNRLEVWSEAEWTRYKKQAERDAGDIAERMSELGV